MMSDPASGHLPPISNPSVKTFNCSADWRSGGHLSVMLGGITGPTAEGTGEITAFRKTQKKADFYDGTLGALEILNGQLLSGFIHDLLETGSIDMQFSLQVSQAQIQ